MTLEIIREVRSELGLGKLPHLPKINLAQQQSLFFQYTFLDHSILFCHHW